MSCFVVLLYQLNRTHCTPSVDLHVYTPLFNEMPWLHRDSQCVAQDICLGVKSVFKVVNSVSHICRYLKGQPFSVSAIINLALWLPRQARLQDYNSIPITHLKASCYTKQKQSSFQVLYKVTKLKKKKLPKYFERKPTALQ